MEADCPAPLAPLKLGFLGDIPLVGLHTTDFQLWDEMLQEELARNPSKAAALRAGIEQLTTRAGSPSTPQTTPPCG